MVDRARRERDPKARRGRSAASSLFSTRAGISIAAALAGCSAQTRPQIAATPAPSPDATATQVTVGGSVSGETVRVSEASNPAAPAGKPMAVAQARPAPVKVGRSGAGLASWYGDRFHGRSTANGERFDMGGFSAAHRSFPLPSYVRVTNASNGRSIVVRVNDRGPFHRERVIDVSRRTADVLGFKGLGVGNVKLDYVGRAPERSDDRRLLASYQEFGRPSAPAGMQMAMAPVSDGDLAAETSGGGGAFALASAAVSTSAGYVASSASAVASTAKTAALKATAAVKSILPGEARPAQPVVVASVAAPSAKTGDAETSSALPPAASAYAAPQPLAATVAAKRVVTPSEPVLASAVPAAPASGGVDVSSRIAAGFEGFDSFAPSARGASAPPFGGLR